MACQRDIPSDSLRDIRGTRFHFILLIKITCTLSWVSQQSPNGIIKKIGFSSLSCLFLSFLGLFILLKYVDVYSKSWSQSKKK